MSGIARLAMALIVVVFGLVQRARAQLAATREDLEHVDGSKLRDDDCKNARYSSGFPVLIAD